MQWHNICIYLWFLPVNQKLYWVSSFDRLMEFFFRDLYVLMWKPYMYLIKSYHLSIMPMWFYVRYSVNSIGRFTGFWVFCINILFVTSTSLYTVLLREESPPPPPLHTPLDYMGPLIRCTIWWLNVGHTVFHIMTCTVSQLWFLVALMALLHKQNIQICLCRRIYWGYLLIKE